MKSQYKYKKTKLLHGIGVNDADYPVIRRDKDRKITWRCHFYAVWVSMITRCYSDRQRCYAGCSVCVEWHSFMSFRKWMVKQSWKGKFLDKDISLFGNKIYSPETCLFVTQEVNKLLNSQNNQRGKWALGVSFNKALDKFTAQLRKHGKYVHIGCFGTELEAEKAYKKAKSNHVRVIALTQKDEKIKGALLLHADRLVGAV